MRLLLIAALTLAGCATAPEPVWMKDGSTRQDFNADMGQCRAQAFSVPGAPLMQVAIVLTSCMEGKGWERRQP